MMLVHIDAELLLSPDQHDEIAETLNEKWNQSWSDGPRLFLYPQYAKLPEVNVLQPHLSALQRSLWLQRSNNSNVNFGWQMELGAQEFFGAGLELKEFEKPDPPETETGDDSAADGESGPAKA